MLEINAISTQLRQNINKERYEHSVRVAETARMLALRFSLDGDKAYIAKQHYNITDNEILQAISYHHEGSVDMTSFDKVIALSDMIEPNRKFDDIGELQHILETNIDEAYFCAYKNIIVNYIKVNSFLEDSRIKVYNHLLFQSLPRKNEK